MSEDDNALRELVADVAAAYFSNSHVAVGDIPQVVSQIAASLQAVGGGFDVASEAPTEQAQPEKLTPAQIRKSITPEALISFEDGKGYKTLKRHLSGHGLTPADYRAKYGLPNDYPMVSSNYSAARSQMAKSLGLGRKPAASAAPAPRKQARKPRQG